MKKRSDPRHLKRIKQFKQIFLLSFRSPDLLPTDDQSLPIYHKLDKIDKKIALSAPEWPIEKINKIDLAILRLAVYELFFKPSVPVKVIIDEAVEIAKEYAGQSSPSFVNGVLGTIVKKFKPRQ